MHRHTKMILLSSMMVLFSFLSSYSVADKQSIPLLLPLEIKGAKISTEKQAQELASQAYYEKAFHGYGGISATLGIHNISIIKIGFDIPNFAKNGDMLWEARAIDMVQGLDAILWINSMTGQVKFIVARPTKAESVTNNYQNVSQHIIKRIIALGQDFPVLKPLEKTYSQQLNKDSVYFEHGIKWILDDPSKPPLKTNGQRPLYENNGFWFRLHFFQGRYEGAAVFSPIEFGDVKLWFEYGYGRDSTIIEAISKIIEEEKKSFLK